MFSKLALVKKVIQRVIKQARFCSIFSSFHFSQNYREPEFHQKFKSQFELAFRNLDVKLRLKILIVRGIPKHIASTTNSVDAFRRAIVTGAH